jgi:O-antigen/teichoic acid export membrane protein
MRRVASQASFYLIADVIGQLSGFISLPIFTRIFSTAQYGVMGLVDSFFKFTGTLSSMGLRPAVLRLYGEFKEGKRDRGPEHLISTMMSASFLLGAAVSVLCLGALLIPDKFLDPEAKQLIAMAAVIMLFRNVSQMLMSLIQVQEKAKLRSALMLAERYLILGFTLLFAAVFRWGLRGFFGGIVAAEGLLFLYCTWHALRHLKWRLRLPDNPILRESFAYGLPLLGLNVTGFVTDWGDRFIMSFYREPGELGIYVAGYTLSNYAVQCFVPALTSALIPVTMNAYAKEGKEATSKTLETFLRYYWLAALPIVFGITAVGEPLIRFVASEKFVDATLVLPWVLAAKVVQAAYFPFLAGLFLSKRTHVLALFMCGAAVLNIGLNLLMIPNLGMVGAAIATLVAYLFYVIGGGIYSQRYLRLRFPVRSFFSYFAAGGGMFLLLRALPTPAGDLATLAIKIPVGMLVFVLLALLLDSEARALARKLRGKLSRS